MTRFTLPLRFIMRSALIAAISFALLSCNPSEQEISQGYSSSSDAERGIRLGMSIDDFRALYPQARVNEGDQFIRQSREFGIPGRWVYSFHGDRLSWFMFNAHQTDVSADLFERTYQAANDFINKYSVLYGTPWREDQGHNEFINPAEKAHRGYKVKEAQWRIPDGRVVVDFSFLGEGGVYSLLLTVQASS